MYLCVSRKEDEPCYDYARRKENLICNDWHYIKIVSVPSSIPVFLSSLDHFPPFRLFAEEDQAPAARTKRTLGSCRGGNDQSTERDADLNYSTINKRENTCMAWHVEG
jgi:hypothetical protein